MNTRAAIGALLLLGFGWGCGASCPQGQEMCDGVCADLASDRNHCGTCGSACGAGEVCDGTGTCAVSCTASLTDCGGSCVDTDTDEAHCGSCGDACAAGELCDGAGGCAFSCASGLTECSGACVDTGTDEAHCGGCGTTCDAGEACTAGSCEPTCGAGLLACGEACVDPLTSGAFCGASGDCGGASAGVACSADQACAGGACVDIHPCSLPPAGGTPGVTAGAVSGPASEGGEAVTYTLVLAAEPCDSVYVTLAPDAQLSVEGTSIVFTRESWDVPQTIRVRAEADPAREGDHSGTVVHTVASGDSAYDGVAVADVTVSIVDTARLWHASVPSTTGSDGDAVLGGVSNAGSVAFLSAGENLVLGDTNDVADVFLFEPATGTVARVSTAADGTEANAASASAAISADGTIVAFFSQATNLTASPVTSSGEFFRVGPTTPIEQITPACAGCSQEISAALAISEDGSAIAFTTRRTYASDTDTEYDLFVWDEGTSALTLESLSSTDGNGTFFWGHNSFGPSLSATGQFAGFQTAARNLAEPEITVQNFHSYVKDRTSRALTRVSYMDGGTVNCDGVHQSSNNSGPQISRDGNVAAFSTGCVFTLSAGTDTNGVDDVLVRDIAAMTTTRVSVASDGTEADGASGILAISDDASLVLFWSDATNLVADDTNAARDLFVRDITAGTTTRVSLGPSYEQLASGAVSGAMSRDGSFVAFVTEDDLLPSDNDTNPDAFADVYVARVR